MRPEPWSDVRSWPALRTAGEERVTLDAPQRAAIARRLDLESLELPHRDDRA